MCVCVCVCVCVCEEWGCFVVTACLPVLDGPVSPRAILLSCCGGLYEGTNSSGHSTPSCRVTGLRQWEALMEGGRQKQGKGVSPHLYTRSRALSSGRVSSVVPASPGIILLSPHPISISPPTGGWGSGVLLLFVSRLLHCPLLSFSALL